MSKNSDFIDAIKDKVENLETQEVKDVLNKLFEINSKISHEFGNDIFTHIGASLTKIQGKSIFPNVIEEGKYDYTGIDLSKNKDEIYFPDYMEVMKYYNTDIDFLYFFGCIPVEINYKLVLHDSLFDKDKYIKDGELTDFYIYAKKFSETYKNVKVLSNKNGNLKDVLLNVEKTVKKLRLEKQNAHYKLLSAKDITINVIISNLKREKKYKKLSFEYLSDVIEKIFIEHPEIDVEYKRTQNYTIVKCIPANQMQKLIGFVSDYFKQEKKNSNIKSSKDLSLQDVLDKLNTDDNFNKYDKGLLTSVVQEILKNSGVVKYDENNEKIICIDNNKFDLVKDIISKSLSGLKIKEVLTEKSADDLTRNDIVKLCRAQDDEGLFAKYTDSQLKTLIKKALNADNSINQYDTESGKCIKNKDFGIALQIMKNYLIKEKEVKQKPVQESPGTQVTEKIEQKQENVIHVATIKIDKYISDDLLKRIEKSCHKQKLKDMLYTINSVNLDPMNMELQGAVQVLQNDGTIIKLPTIKHEYGCTLSQSCDLNRNSDRKRLVWTVGEGPNGTVFVAVGFVEEHMGTTKIRKAYKKLLDESAIKQTFTNEQLSKMINVSDFIKNNFSR